MLGLSGWYDLTNQMVSVHLLNTLPPDTFLDLLPDDIQAKAATVVADYRFPLAPGTAGRSRRRWRRRPNIFQAAFPFPMPTSARCRSKVWMCAFPARRPRIARRKSLHPAGFRPRCQPPEHPGRLLSSGQQPVPGPCRRHAQSPSPEAADDAEHAERSSTGSGSKSPSRRTSSWAAWREIPPSIALARCRRPTSRSTAWPCNPCKGNLNITNEVMHITGATLTRPEGIARGDVHMAFSNQTLRLDCRQHARSARHRRDDRSRRSPNS